MNSTNFSYWLQGLFELSSPEILTEDQVKCIRRHLEVTANTEKLTGFTCWLSGFLDAIPPGDLPNYYVLKIKEKLHDEFEHVIDTQIKNKDVLQKIHDGTKYPSDNGGFPRGQIMC